MPRRKSKRRRRELNVYYVVEIDNWDWSYSFGLDESRYRDEPYREFRHLTLTGKLLRPGNLKADEVEITLMPDARLKEETRKRDEPRAVGSLISSRGHLQVLLPFPSEALEPILQTLIAGKLHYVTIDGSPLHYRQGLVKHFRLESSYDPAELPPETK
jgi:hypothetical protein